MSHTNIKEMARSDCSSSTSTVTPDY